MTTGVRSSVPTVVLVDALRAFADGRRCRTARSADEALELLRQYEFATLDELWLDYDLGRAPDGSPLTAQPIVDELVRAAEAGRPYPLGEVHIHGRDVRGAARTKAELEGAGYRVVREYGLRTLRNPFASRAS